MNGVLAKIGGWAQFGLTLLAAFASQGTPHGWAQWAIAIGSLASAIGIHAASNVGSLPSGVAGSTTVQAQHVSQ